MHVIGVILNVIIGGFVIFLFIGFIIGIKEKEKAEANKQLEESSRKAHEQRVKWASEIKQRALNLNSTCGQNKSAYKALVATPYKASSQIENIISELAKVAELQGKIDSLAEELSKKGGAL